MPLAVPIQIILGIPGLWRTRGDIVLAIASQAQPYIYSGNMLLSTETKQMCVVHMYEHGPSLREAFAIAGQRSLTTEDLDRIAAHTLTAYLISDGGTFDAAAAMMGAGRALLRAGGLAVKVETSGIAHAQLSGKPWRQYTTTWQCFEPTLQL